jgi:4-hydroxy-2-oxoheptanedioate aldolase
MRDNHFKQRLLAGEQLIGFWSMLAHSGVLEVATQTAFDWVLIDTEHSPNELPMVQDQLRCVAQSGIPALVRPSLNDRAVIKRLLDVGAQTLVIPMVDSVEDAERAVSAVRYPPRGQRGVSLATRANLYGKDADYLREADQRVCLVVQIETVGALENLEAIAAVEGVDALFVGPSDLAAALGHLGNFHHPAVQDAIFGALRRAHRVQKRIGVLMPDQALAERYVEAGFDFVAVATDIGLLRSSTEAVRKRFTPVSAAAAA